MTAASVTGVGQGSADKAGQKGSEHLFVGVEKLIGTRVVLSGVSRITAGTSVTVNLPQNLPGVWNSTFVTSEDSPGDTVPPSNSDYAVFVSPFNDIANRYQVTAMTTTSDVQNFVITASASVTKDVAWMIVRLSTASVTGFPTHN